MTYQFKVEEKAVYVQHGTVSVEAPNEEEARKLVRSGYYEHQGDNEIDYNTEKLLSTKIIELVVDEDQD